MNAGQEIRNGSFVSEDLEESFLRESLPQDLRTARYVLLFASVCAVMFAINDWRLLAGTPPFRFVLITRIGLILFMAAAWFRLRRPSTSYRTLNALLIIWIVPSLLMALYVQSTRPAYWINNAFAVLLVIVLSIVVPVRFTFQVWLASSFAFACMVLFVAKKPDTFLLMGNLFALALAPVVGVAYSAILHRTRRESFAANMAAKEMIGRLEMALAEVKKLEGILSICSACKKIRQEDGAWTGLESYISDRSEARFSHGLCPDCLQKHYPEFVPRPSR